MTKRRSPNLLIYAVISLLLFTINSSLCVCFASTAETIKTREILIDLGDGLTTEAELTLPAVGDGPFPGVLLVPGGGTPDMDEYMPPYATETGEPAKPHLQLATYLSERGFAVLRYNKRGVGFNSTLSDPQVFFDTTIQDLEGDAVKALTVLRQQPEVDPEDITLIGHSESTIIVPRVATGNLSVKNIVLMGTAGRSYYDIKHFKTVELRVKLANEVLDQDNDGRISVSEAVTGLGDGPKTLISITDLMENSSGEWKWLSAWDHNGDGYMDIDDEFAFTLERVLEYAMTAEYMGSKLIQSQLALPSTIETIRNVSSSVLILQGTNDILTPLEDALLLEQRLTMNHHPDHTLITYPGLGHYFYPEDYWSIAMGPIETYVLQDLEAWLKNPVRQTAQINYRLENTESKIIEIMNKQNNVNNLSQQLTVLQAEVASLQDKIIQLEQENTGLKETLVSTNNLTYLIIGLLIIATGIVIVLRNRNHD
jgi:pimeloyl-ACP methyl ester carboxylesterase